MAFDFEWDATKDNIIDAVSFVDNNGNSEVKLRERDFGGSEIDLLRYIMAKLLRYRWSIGWNTQGNAKTATGKKIYDLLILHDRCKKNGIKSRVRLGNKGLPCLIGNEISHIDLYTVYTQEMVQDGMYHGAYRAKGLDDVSRALLGYGKYNDYHGQDFKTLPVEEQEKYSLQDSKLVMDLSKFHNYEVLDSMLAIADITGLDFEKVCRTHLSTWWSAIFDKDPKSKFYKRLKFTGSYKGAEVLTPRQGFYTNITNIDAMSLYPSVGIKYNLSFDTINCDCCKHNPDAKISNIIPEEFTKDCKYVNANTDWICKRHTGAFPAKLLVFRKERFEQKKAGNKAKQYAFKILINGGYGVFGEKEFSFYDPRVAELVTATGRYTLSKMQKIAKEEYGFEIIYGDTDSLFLQNTTEDKLKAFQERFEKEYEIGLEVKNNYDKLLLSKGKKHYVGIENGKLDIVGMEGKKNDRSEYQQQVYRQLIENILIHSEDPLPDVRKAFNKIGERPELLLISQELGQEIEEVDNNNQTYAVAKAIGAKKGEIVSYYKSDKDKFGKSWTQEPSEINLWKYKELLWNTIYETVQIAGHSIAELAKELGIRLEKDCKAKENCGVSKKQRLLENYNIVYNKTDNIGGDKV